MELNKKPRKPILTLSTLVENQQKEFEEFVRSASAQGKLENFIRSRNPSKELIANQANLLSEIAPELLRTKFDGISMLVEEIKNAQNESQKQFLKEIENAISALDSRQLLESSMNIGFDELRQLEGCLIDLPKIGVQSALDKFCTLNFDIEEFKTIEPNNHYLLTTITSKTIDIDNIQLKTMQQTQMQVQSLTREVKEIREEFIQDAKDKDALLEELLDYYRNGGSGKVIVEKVKYNKKTAELIIDHVTIKIMADTNQHELCKILFANKASTKKTWEIDELIEALGEDINIRNNWKDMIYQTVRHLNQKVQAETSIDRFIIYNNKTVLVNPKYSR